MLDQERAARLFQLAETQKNNANKYFACRHIAAKAKVDIEILLTASLSAIRSEKPNCGIEMAYMMLMEKSEEARKLYREWQENEAKYKGLERILEAQATEIMFYQSFMKWQKEGETYG